MEQTFTLGKAPAAWPLVGHGIRFARRPFEFLDRQRRYGDLVKIKIGTRTAYVINHPELTRRALVDQVREFDRGTQFEKLVPILGHGVMLSTVSEHRRHRRLMQPAFHPPRMAGYVETIQSVAAGMIDDWRDHAELDLTHEITVLAVEVAGRTMFSTDMAAAVVQEIHRSLEFVLATIVHRTVSPFSFVTEKLPTATNRRFDRDTRRMRDMVSKVISAYRAAGVDHGDAMSMLLTAREAETGDHLTDEECIDDCMALLIGGSHTVGAAMSFAIHLLGEHPDAYRRIQNEIDMVLGSRPVNIDDLAQLNYARQFCMEVLRLYPSGWILTRKTNCDTSLGGHALPAGCTAIISPYAQHRDPDLFPEPDLFDPDRWAPHRTDHGDRYAYIPFGLGTRRCPGDGLAMLEMPAILATILQRWHLVPLYQGEAAKLGGQVLRAGPTPMRLELRQQSQRSLPADS